MVDTDHRSLRTQTDRPGRGNRGRWGYKDLEKGSSENYLGGEPLSLTPAIFIQDS